MLVVALSAVFIAFTFYVGVGLLKDQHQGKVFRQMAEDYLAKEDVDDLIEYVEERLATHPQDVWAHWYMGQAKYHKGRMPDSKRSFERVIELEPSWYSSVDSWIEKIDEKLDEGPKLVE